MTVDLTYSNRTVEPWLDVVCTSCSPWQGLRERTHAERGANMSQFGGVSLLLQGKERDAKKRAIGEPVMPWKRRLLRRLRKLEQSPVFPRTCTNQPEVAMPR